MSNKFASKEEVRWCPGCGDYAILAAIQKAMEKLEIKHENIVFISGIGCSSRLPYYMNTYGFHTLHGRATSIATGVKLANSDLSVWVITGDGDSLSIGLSHLMHLLRRNVDVKVLLFNNRIYGLTKGQYSPTSLHGTVTASSPHGNYEYPLNPLSVAYAANASFMARTIDTDSQMLQDIILKAAAHKGAAFIEILQNCNIFNDGAFESFTAREVRKARTITLQDKTPMLFGDANDQGLFLEGTQDSNIELVVKKVDAVNQKDVLMHRINQDPAWLSQLIRIGYPEFPVPLGILRAIERPVFTGAIATKSLDFAELDRLLQQQSVQL